MKIKYELLKSWCDQGLSNMETKFMLHIVQYQNDYGQIRGIYYRDVCNACHMCKQTFYNTIRSLDKKGLIRYKRNRDDYDITILNNDFSYEGAFKEGYINVSRKVFHTRKFKQLRAKEKILLMLFMRVTHENASSYQIGCEKFYKKYMELLGVTKRILRGYLHSMRSFFSIGIKDGKYFITFLASVFRERSQVSETDQFLGHIVKVECRHSKIKNPEEGEINETIQVIKQYRREAKRQLQDIFNIISNCIQISVSGIKEKCLNGRYIHKLVKETLTRQTFVLN